MTGNCPKLQALECRSVSAGRFFYAIAVLYLLIQFSILAAITEAGNRDNSPCWIYFTDKGLDTESDLNAALNTAISDLTDKARRRRERAGRLSLVDFNDLRVNPHYIAVVSEIIGNSPRTISRWLNAVSINLHQSLQDSLEQLSFVSHIEPVRSFVRYLPEIRPFLEDENAIPPRRDDHRFEYGTSIRQNAFINAPELHDRDLTGQDVLIGLTDTGFNNLNHNCFEALDVVAAWDFVNDDDDVADGDDIGNGNHGTYTLSIIAGFDPGLLIGIAPDASYVLAKTESTEWEREVEEDYWIAAVEWMDSLGVDIISASLSYFNWYDFEDKDGNTAPITIAADRAVEVGMVVVASMGNTGRAHHPGNKMGAPADGDSVFSIGATNMDSTMAAFSSYGPTWDGRIKPDFTTTGVSVKFASGRHDDTYGIGVGTSFSTPAISGLCALLLQANPQLTPMMMRDILREVSHNSESPDTSLGWGIPDGLAALNEVNQLQNRLVITLASGWNIISHNVFLDNNPSIPEAFRHVVDRNNLFLVGDGFGRFYSPSFRFNNIPDWDPYQGYKVRAFNPDSLIFEGQTNNQSQPIPLMRGWQIIAYLPDFPLSVEEAFASLVRDGCLIIARDEAGFFYLPEQNFNNMPALVPGRGYILRLRWQCDLIYPRIQGAATGHWLRAEPVMFPLPEPGSDCMSVLLTTGNTALDGDEIGFFDSGNRLIGSGVFEDGKCGVALWGESPGEFPTARIYRKLTQDLVKPEIEWVTGPSEFRPGEYAVLRADLDDVHTETGCSILDYSVNPNPFNNRFSVCYSSVGEGKVEITVYDLLGRLITSQANRSSVNGMFMFDTSKWSGGSYIVQLMSGSDMKQSVIRLVK